MRHRYRASAALISTLLILGCGAPLGQLPAPPTGAARTAPAPLQVQSVEASSEASVAIDEAATTTTSTRAEAIAWAEANGTNASSSRNLYFRSSYLTDGNLRSAWGPSPSDTQPTLTFRLNACTSVTAMAIKMDGGATFDVQVSEAGGAWKTIATGRSPERATLVTLPLVGADRADQMRLVFRGDTSQLLVCEMALHGTECGSGGGGGAAPQPSMMPSAGPSVTPTIRPSATPTARPTAQPSPDDEHDDDTTGTWDTSSRGPEGDDDDTTGTDDSTGTGDDDTTGTHDTEGDDDETIDTRDTDGDETASGDA